MKADKAFKGYTTVERRVNGYVTGGVYLIVTHRSSTQDDQVAVFSGPDADRRAREYASWKFGYLDTAVAARNRDI